MLKNFKLAINNLLNLFLIIFSLKCFQFLIDFLIHFLLKCKGYKNFGGLILTGEYYFLKKISNFDLKNSIDVGANIGEYSQQILKLTNSKVYAFEVDIIAFKELKLLKNKYKNRFKPINLGLSNLNKQLNFYHYGAKSQLSSFNKNIEKFHYVEKKRINVKKILCVTGDKYFKEKVKKNKIDFIKIDTEGHDYNVLMGLNKTIKKSNTKFIQFEMNWHNLFSQNNLQSFGKKFKNYNFYRILPFFSGLIQIDINHPNNNIFHLCNIVMIRKDIKII